MLPLFKWIITMFRKIFTSHKIHHYSVKPNSVHRSYQGFHSGSRAGSKPGYHKGSFGCSSVVRNKKERRK